MPGVLEKAEICPLGSTEPTTMNVLSSAPFISMLVRWTEPTDFAGHRVSQVTYTYHGVDPIPVMPPAEQARIAEPKESTMPFELQSDGWRPMPR